MLRQRDQGTGRQLLGHHRQIVLLAAGKGHVAVHCEQAAAYGRATKQLTNLMIDRTILRIAMRGEPQSVTTRNIVAAKVANGSVGAYLQLCRSTCESRFEQHGTTPTLVATGDELCELP